MFYGYAPIIYEGFLNTLKLSLLSLLLSIILGLVCAGFKVSRYRLPSHAATLYTTLVRSVPDLVLMLLIFYSIQIQINRLTEWLGYEQIYIDPFYAGVLTLGFIYGAYTTEAFRGAFQSIAKGQIEAAVAYGMSTRQRFTRIIFPQLMNLALPGLFNNWQCIIKATALVSIIGLSDIVSTTQDAAKATQHMLYFSIVSALIYLFISTVSNLILMWLTRHYEIGGRKVCS